MDKCTRQSLLAGEVNYPLQLPNGVLSREFCEQYAETLAKQERNDFYREQSMYDNKTLIIRLIDSNDLTRVRQYVEMGLPFHEKDLPQLPRPLDYAGMKNRREIFAYLLSVTQWNLHEYEQDSPHRYVYDDDEMYNMLLPHTKHFLFNVNDRDQGPFTFPFIFGDIERIYSLLAIIPREAILSKEAWTGTASIGDHVMKYCIHYGQMESVRILQSLGIEIPSQMELYNVDENLLK